MPAPSEYIVYVDPGVLGIVDTTWTLKSPDLTVWDPSITTGGVLSFTSGGTELNTPRVPAWNGTGWDPSITNGGVVSVTSGAAMSASDQLAALIDSSSVAWYLVVNDNDELQVTTDDIITGVIRYPSVHLTFTATADTDTFDIHAIKPNMKERRR